MKLFPASRLFALLLCASLIPSCGGNGPPASPSPSAASFAGGAAPSVSQGGRFVVFQTNPTGAAREVVVVDRVNATSFVVDGTDVSNASVTPDGRLLAFDAVPAGGGSRQVFLRDQTTGEVTLISARADGVAGAGDSTNPSVSDNGAFVAFQSDAVDLGARSPSTNSVLVREVGSTTIRSASSGTTSSDVNPAVSGNGRFVAFESRPLGGTGFPIVMLWSAATGQQTLVSVTPSGAPPDGPSGSPSVNLDGRIVAFESRATNLATRESPPEVFAGESNVFVRDVLTNTMVTASAPVTPGVPANGDSRNPSISGDGTRVAFDSTASNLAPDAVVSGESNVFVRDLTTETTMLVTRPAAEPASTPAPDATAPGAGAARTTSTPVVPTVTQPTVPTGASTGADAEPPPVPTGTPSGLADTTTPVVSTGAGTTSPVAPTGTASGLTTGAPVVSTGTGGSSAGTALPTGTGTSAGASLPVPPVSTGNLDGSTPVVPSGSGTGGSPPGGTQVTSTPVPTTGSTSPFGPTTPVVDPIAPVTVAAVAVGNARPSLSPDGLWVAFESRKASGTRIFIADLLTRSIAEIPAR